MTGTRLTRRSLLAGGAAAVVTTVVGCSRDDSDTSSPGAGGTDSIVGTEGAGSGPSPEATTDTSVPTSSPPASYVPAQGGSWESVEPEGSGWSTEGVDALVSMVEGSNSNSLTVTVGGRLLVERYFGATTATTTQDVASVQKSVVSTLVGIVRHEGLLDLDQTVTGVLGAGWSRAAPADEAKVTVRHVLTMSSGLHPDRLDKVAEPGAVFTYNTAVYQKLRLVLEAVTGSDIDALTRSRLLDPIGAGPQSRWKPRRDVADQRDAVGSLSWGLQLTALDMARFGLLSLRRGRWGEEQVVPADWFDAAWAPSAANPDYGYLWWLLGRSARGRRGPRDWVAALGAADQKVYVVPSLDLVLTRQGQAAEEAGEAATRWDRRLMGALLDARA